MIQTIETVVGIDVGGERKGFHAVALRDGIFVDKVPDINPEIIVQLCLEHRAVTVAVDAPCKSSQTGSSRSAERELNLYGSKIHCFATPTREYAVNHTKGFYKWMLNGERLYQLLTLHYSLFKGKRQGGRECIETFPQAVMCAIKGKPIHAKHKLSERPTVLKNMGYDISSLSNIDFIDAALCAITADEGAKTTIALLATVERDTLWYQLTSPVNYNFED